MVFMSSCIRSRGSSRIGLCVIVLLELYENEREQEITEHEITEHVNVELESIFVIKSFQNLLWRAAVKIVEVFKWPRAVRRKCAVRSCRKGTQPSGCDSLHHWERRVVASCHDNTVL